MRRRDFIRSAGIAAASAAVARLSRTAKAQDLSAVVSADESVKRVLVVFKCHLDVGFTDTQANVMTKYFKVYYPLAVETAATRRVQGKDLYIWTTGSWLLYEYLEQASPEERKAMEQAIASGDIAWHSLPFSWQTEMLDHSTIQGCLGFSKTLDSRFGRRTIAGKMTDVPGHTRGIISPLASGDVRLLDIGVNPLSTPPEVPDAFLWKDDHGASIAVLYHRQSYGSVVRVPGSDLAVDVEVYGDNAGPHSAQQIDAIYARLRKEFPSAQISPASLSDIAVAMEPSRASLPIVTGEIGDTWIYGVPSDPPKIAKHRELSRLRNEWLAANRFSVGDETDRQLLRRLTLAVEHTWGTDTKRYIDYDHYPPEALKKVIDKPGYQTMERSWQEKRHDIDEGVHNLPAPLRSEALARLETLKVYPPNTSGMRTVDSQHMLLTKHFELAVNPTTGAIQHLVNRSTGKAWASPNHPLALFSYQTLSQDDYTKFYEDYIVLKIRIAAQDFGKPEIEKFKAESRTWKPTLRKLQVEETDAHHRMVATLAVEDTEAEKRGLVAWPGALYLEVVLAKKEPSIQISFYALGKIANRMPEAMWLSFQPQIVGLPTWSLTKINQQVSPMDVIKGGSRRMHAITDKFTVRDGGHQLEIETLDAPVLAFDPMSPLNFGMDPPDLNKGVHVSLFNNAWGTNYPQWAGGDWKYRFVLKG